ncbi:ABC transporter permease [Halofilum ochraceum]|uniref:ABC transporter permease n=1 Tax=Halofilum ochraceum TaxID=1611323 RepID=UPI000835D2B8|nr:iron ABC transporter permease [Halofilum ochraceum]
MIATALSRLAPAWRRARAGINAWGAATWLIAALVALPILAVLAHAFVPAPEVWDHLASTVLPRYLINTFILGAGVAALALGVGVGSAWLVVMCRFPGRRIFEWALLLPLAVPTYVIAYAYTDFLQFTGPIQTALRGFFDWTRHDYWFPDIRSLGGAIVLLALVLYPYIYVLTRASFLEQSACVLEVGRTLGRTPARLLFGVAIPLARPAIAGGTALVLMETLNEFGAVHFFGVDTFTTGIYRTWFGLGEPVAAAQLAASLLAFVILLVLAERWSRGQARYFHTTSRYRELPRFQLHGARAALATLACATPITVGFLLPGGLLLGMSITDGDDLFSRRFVDLTTNSVTLAAVSAVVAVMLALLLSYGVRLQQSRSARLAARIAAMGYAVPGAVIAVGILIPLGAVDRTLHAFFQDQFGISTGLILTGTMVALVYAYVVRFLAVAYNAIEASLEKVTPNMDAASRTLGKTAGRTLRLIHAPMMRSSLLAAGLLVFVDVMKELPATVILRPFNFDTLAIRAHQLASDERLAEAATASLMIVAVGIVPVILLSRAMGRSRPGSTDAD